MKERESAREGDRVCVCVCEAESRRRFMRQYFLLHYSVETSLVELKESFLKIATTFILRIFHRKYFKLKAKQETDPQIENHVLAIFGIRQQPCRLVWTELRVLGQHRRVLQHHLKRFLHHSPADPHLSSLALCNCDRTRQVTLFCYPRQ